MSSHPPSRGHYHGHSHSHLDHTHRSFVLVLTCEQHKPLAEALSKLGGHNVRLGNIRWDNFRDGSPNLFIEHVERVKKAESVIFLASFHNGDAIFSQLAMIYALPRYLARSLTVVLPYFPTGTMERIDTEGQVATAMTLARMLSAVPLSRSGPMHLLMYDIHALSERFYFSDSVIPLCDSAVPLFAKSIGLRPNINGIEFPPSSHQANIYNIERLRESGELISIAFPDEGAKKRFGNMWEGFPLISCQKVRNGDERVISVFEGDCQDRHVVIMDDLVQTGGTLLQSARAVKERGARRVSICCTHAVFPGDSWKKFLDADIQTFWVTNSNPVITDQLKMQPFEVISLAPSIASHLSEDLMQKSGSVYF